MGGGMGMGNNNMSSMMAGMGNMGGMGGMMGGVGMGGMGDMDDMARFTDLARMGEMFPGVANTPRTDAFLEGICGTDTPRGVSSAEKRGAGGRGGGFSGL